MTKRKKKVVQNKRQPLEKVEVIIRKKTLGQAPHERHFVLNDGKRLKTVHDLAKELKEMSEDVFKHHVNEARNDFSNWLEDVFDEKELAEEIRKAENKIDAEVKLLRRMVDELLK